MIFLYVHGIIHLFAGVAQLVEQRIRNAQVTCSSPATGLVGCCKLQHLFSLLIHILD